MVEAMRGIGMGVCAESNMFHVTCDSGIASASSGAEVASSLLQFTHRDLREVTTLLMYS